MTKGKMCLSLENVSFSYDDLCVLENINVEFQQGQITTILGANGCGKSTLLALLSRQLSPQKGQIFLQETALKQIHFKKFAKQVAVVYQKHQFIDDMIVYDMVALGRLPHQGFFQRDKSLDHETIAWALKLTDLEDLAYRELQELSGGERQRVFIAMALAQKTPVLLLDEPTTYLDIKYQIDVLRLIQKINQELGITIIMVLHDINHALAVSDKIVGLKDGKLYAQGTVDQVVDEAFIEAVFGLSLPMITVDGKPYVVHSLRAK
ncbi:ABC transporter ATP-binding protein [Streptococcus iniae]|uniref:ABC transporter ATP-binding protein n=1 Tax=Streptococcus iniae TaxID=1346 RepID=A0A3L8GGB5_STRIN|nr:ABC transporter ATP-binding protein [Streptococcus iniae]AGM99542.1 ABC transporter, ATP-binding protein [Streptococcus iniae SF1]ESR10438.1 iron ABC transporter ATP-binding protein [Streptococcus iniae IUSA1]AHY16466.1 iron ABC transporter ATP-binding protein [Streptococcus iniae]AHY18329.1 iron ABC transporter ATP-binding protein [Streptococcus iniae]AJG26612.1 iron ABC transporter ATP-binding protein [Streptococcus iniae]